MNIPMNLLELNEYYGDGYKPLIDFESWRVAVLNYTDEYLPENLNTMQRHNDTDEVFVLLKGHCILFLGSGVEKVEEIFAVDLQPLKFYNVKKGCWHTHTLRTDTAVLIVENRNTVSTNSPMIDLSTSQSRELGNLTRQHWQE